MKRHQLIRIAVCWRWDVVVMTMHVGVHCFAQ